MLIRAECPEDESDIFAVHAAAFPTPLEARLVDALRAAGSVAVSLIAEVEGHVAGHIAFSPVTVEGAAGGLGLGPLGVRPEFQRQGVGLALAREGLAAAKASGAGFVVVLGDPAFYGRAGFRPAAEWGLVDEYGGGKAFQALELRPGSIPPGAGLVRYASEFGMVA